MRVFGLRRGGWNTGDGSYTHLLSPAGEYIDEIFSQARTDRYMQMASPVIRPFGGGEVPGPPFSNIGTFL